jgi:hypothetical protein
VAVQLRCPPVHAQGSLLSVLNVEEDLCAYKLSLATPLVCHLPPAATAAAD